MVHFHLVSYWLENPCSIRERQVLIPSQGSCTHTHFKGKSIQTKSYKVFWGQGGGYYLNSSCWICSTFHGRVQYSLGHKGRLNKIVQLTDGNTRLGEGREMKVWVPANSSVGFFKWDSFNWDSPYLQISYSLGFKSFWKRCKVNWLQAKKGFEPRSSTCWANALATRLLVKGRAPLSCYELQKMAGFGIQFTDVFTAVNLE